jgi:uncharacterized OB-fold protein
MVRLLHEREQEKEMKTKCKRCGINKKTLTNEGLCAYCHKEKTGAWAFEFSDRSKKK